MKSSVPNAMKMQIFIFCNVLDNSDFTSSDWNMELNSCVLEKGLSVPITGADALSHQDFKEVISNKNSQENFKHIL